MIDKNEGRGKDEDRIGSGEGKENLVKSVQESGHVETSYLSARDEFVRPQFYVSQCVFAPCGISLLLRCSFSPPPSTRPPAPCPSAATDLKFPSSNLFAAAGDGIWDNGAACGRQYLVRCISAAEPGTCIPEQVIQVRIIDYALQMASPQTYDDTTMVLSDTSFGTIVNSTADSINIEFQQYAFQSHSLSLT
ncbi:hypothetical protein LXL04_035301 [Taraxacum kok-saghyz]